MRRGCLSFTFFFSEAYGFGFGLAWPWLYGLATTTAIRRDLARTTHWKAFYWDAQLMMNAFEGH